MTEVSSTIRSSIRTGSHISISAAGPAAFRLRNTHHLEPSEDGEQAKVTSPQRPDHESHGEDSRAADGVAVSPWRLAGERDFDRVVEMNECLNVEDPSETVPFDRANIRRTLAELRKHPIRGTVAVLELGGRLCGYALLISFWSNEYGGEICAIDELYVEQGFRRRGLATQLIQELARGDSRLWPRRPAMIMIEAYRSNSRAKALYEKLGFEASPNHLLTLVLAGRER
jgi:GNAT superfamily N-acetyltransferase